MEESDFKFLGYRVSSITFEIKDGFSYQSKISPKISVQQNFDPERKKFVEVILKIKITNEEDSLIFNMELKGGFQANENITEDLFKKVSEQNAPAILFPFARAIITNYTALANIPPIILPSINFSK
jgi:preprotein translocase subunit SecB